MIARFFQRNALGIQHGGQLFKGKHRVGDALIMLGLVLLGHAGADKDGFRAGIALFDILAVRLHGRCDVGQEGQGGGVVFLNQQVNAMATGGNEHVALFLLEDALVLALYDGCAQRGFFRIGKAQGFEGFSHALDAHALVVGGKGRREAGDHRRAGLQQHAHLFGFIHDFLGVLRADHKALAAQDALVANDIGLVARKADGLNRAVADALIAVLAVGFFQRQAVGHGGFLLSGVWWERRGIRWNEGDVTFFSEESNKEPVCDIKAA